jgi:hypothetical protein
MTRLAAGHFRRLEFGSQQRYIRLSAACIRHLGPPSLLSNAGFFLSVKWPVRENDHSPQCDEKVKNAWSYTSTPLIQGMHKRMVRFQKLTRNLFLTLHGQWWYVNAVFNAVYIPPLPVSLKEVRDRIKHALHTITADILHRVWDEFDYRVDVCRVTQGAHIEGL